MIFFNMSFVHLFSLPRKRTQSQGCNIREAKCLGSQLEYGVKFLKNCEKPQLETNKYTAYFTDS